jgi:predicted CopG family antitoxin
MCILAMPNNMQNRYTTIRVDLEVYNALLTTKRILEQAYNRKFSLSETIQVVNRLSSDTIQKISSARRELDEMLVGRGKLSAKDLEHLLKSSERAIRSAP